MEKTCINCGATFDENEPKCPYCGHINEAGAEKEYGEKLEDIREKLDIVDNIAEDNYKASLKIFFKAMITSTIVFLIIAFVVFNLAKVAAQSAKRNDIEKGIEAINSCQGIFETRNHWDELYEAQKYEDLYQAMESNSNGGSIYSWEHYYFYSAYSYYARTMNHINEVFEENHTLREYDVSSLLYNGFSLYAMKDDEKKLNSHDMEVLNAYWDDVMNDICTALNITYDELMKMADECMDEYGISYSAASDVAKKYMEERK